MFLAARECSYFGSMKRTHDKRRAQAIRAWLVGAWTMVALAGGMACREADAPVSADLLHDVAFVPPEAFGSSTVDLGIFMRRTETTQEEFLKFVHEQNYSSTTVTFLDHLPRAQDGARMPDPSRSHHPIVHISPRDAAAYAAHAGMRLPTREEWEGAAAYPGGDLLFPFGIWQDLRANTLELNLGRTTPVGLFENGRSYLSIYDLAGNVSEFARAGTDEYIAKGGSYLQFATRIKPQESELVFGGDFAAADVGFRCVADAVSLFDERLFKAGIEASKRIFTLQQFIKNNPRTGGQLLARIAQLRPQFAAELNAVRN